MVIGEDYVIKADSMLSYNETKASLILQQIPQINDCEISGYPTSPAPVVKWYFEKYPTGGKRRCVFLHGVGQEFNIGVVDSFTDYWGDVNDYVKDLCTDIKFLIADTKLYGWTNHTLQQQYCTAAIGKPFSQQSVIVDTIIFTHSMGNLVLAGALQNGYCSLGQNSYWFDSQGPILGSPLPYFLYQFCSFPLLPSGWKTDPESLIGSYCQGNSIYPAYTTMIPASFNNGNINLNTLPSIVQKYVSGVMCGTQPWSSLGPTKENAGL